MYHSAMEPRPVSCSSFVPLLRRMSYLILKRGFDLVFSLVLLVTCALLMAVIALVVWLDSPGKIIYTQIRLGYGGKPFTIYKFRSMQQSTAPDDAKWTSENDTRITRVGHILRLTHLDELPQLLNIFMGEMSFVGPRPERPTVYDDLDGKVENFRSRMQVMPGLTGYAQVNGGYDLNPAEKLKYDLIYINTALYCLTLVPAKNNTCCFYNERRKVIFLPESKTPRKHFVMHAYRA